MICIAGLGLDSEASISLNKSTSDPPRKSVQDGISYYQKSHEVGLTYGAMKYLNWGGLYQYEVKPIKWFSVYGGASLSTMYYKIYSTRGIHEIFPVWSCVNSGARLHFINRRNFHSYYLFGTYGYAQSLTRNSNGLKSDFFHEYGIGAIMPQAEGIGVQWKFEFGRQEYQLEGRTFSSFQSIIDYDLVYTSFFFRFGWAFHSSKKYGQYHSRVRKNRLE